MGKKPPMIPEKVGRLVLSGVDEFEKEMDRLMKKAKRDLSPIWERKKLTDPEREKRIRFLREQARRMNKEG